VFLPETLSSLRTDRRRARGRLSALALLLAILALTLSLHAVQGASARSIGPWSHSTVADFSGCSTPTNVVVANSAGGEIRLAASQEDYFNAPPIDYTRWVTGRIYPWGGADPAIANGLLTLDGSWLRSQNPFTATTRAIEFRARLRPAAADTGWPALGLGRQADPGGSGSSEAHRLWTANDLNELFATAHDGSATPIEQLVAGVDLTQFHTFRIEWGPSSTAYSIDGVTQATLTASSPAQAWAWLYTLTPGSPIEVDWVRVAPYTSTTGEFVSCPIDAEDVTTWGNLTWAADTPAGTSLSFQTRSSSDGATWSAWSDPLTSSASPIQSPANRYLQYRATLSSTDSTRSPEVRQVLVTAQAGWRDTALADFNTCGEPVNVSIADANGGELRLASVLEDYFYNPTIDTTRWITGQLYFYGGAFPPTVTNGILSINASYLRSVLTMTQPLRVFESRTRFRVPPPNTNYGDVGFGRQTYPGGPDPNGDNRLFITDDQNRVFANARNFTGTITNTLMTGVDPALWHVYRI
jgi:hypothetical protein